MCLSLPLLVMQLVSTRTRLDAAPGNQHVTTKKDLYVLKLLLLVEQDIQCQSERFNEHNVTEDAVTTV